MTSHELSKKKKQFLKEIKKNIKSLENDIKKYENEQSKILKKRKIRILLLNLRRIYPYIVFTGVSLCLFDEIPNSEKNNKYIQKKIDSYGNIKYEDYISDDASNLVLSYSDSILENGLYSRNVYIYDAYNFKDDELIELVLENKINLESFGKPINEHIIQTTSEPIYPTSYTECIVYEEKKQDYAYGYIYVFAELLSELLGCSAIAYYREKYSDFSYEKCKKNIEKELPNCQDIEDLKKILEIRKDNYKMIRGKK